MTKTRGRNVFSKVEQMLDEHSKRSSPVSDVVLSNYLVPCSGIHPDESVPNNGRTKVADMHLLCHIRSGVIDHHSSWFSTLMQPEVFVVFDFGQQVIDGAIGEGDVDKPRSCDLKRRAKIVKLA